MFLKGRYSPEFSPTEGFSAGTQGSVGVKAEVGPWVLRNRGAWRDVLLGRSLDELRVRRSETLLAVPGCAQSADSVQTCSDLGGVIRCGGPRPGPGRRG